MGKRRSFFSCYIVSATSKITLVLLFRAITRVTWPWICNITNTKPHYPFEYWRWKVRLPTSTVTEEAEVTGILVKMPNELTVISLAVGEAEVHNVCVSLLMHFSLLIHLIWWADHEFMLLHYPFLGLEPFSPIFTMTANTVFINKRFYVLRPVMSVLLATSRRVYSRPLHNMGLKCVGPTIP